MTHICYARPDRYEPHTQRCAVCRLSWDIDDSQAPPCPRQVATRAHDESLDRSNKYVSALAPERF
jgi:hypothetical protein